MKKIKKHDLSHSVDEERRAEEIAKHRLRIENFNEERAKRLEAEAEMEKKVRKEHG